MNFFANTCRKAILRPLSILLFLSLLGTAVLSAQVNESTLFKSVAPDYPDNVVQVGNVFYFQAVANGASGGITIWKSDGTQAGTQPLASNAADGRIATPVVPFSNAFYYLKVKNTGEVDLWKLDATTNVKVETMFVSTVGDFKTYELLVRQGRLSLRYYYFLDGNQLGFLYQTSGVVGGSKLIGTERTSGATFQTASNHYVGSTTTYIIRDSFDQAGNPLEQNLLVKDAVSTRLLRRGVFFGGLPPLRGVGTLNNEFIFLDNNGTNGLSLYKINAAGTRTLVNATVSL